MPQVAAQLMVAGLSSPSASQPSAGQGGQCPGVQAAGAMGFFFASIAAYVRHAADHRARRS
jgi:hypothetical protein